MSHQHENIPSNLIESQASGFEDTERIQVRPELCAQLEDAGLMLRRALDEATPHFMHSVRELWSVAGETRDLTRTMHDAASLIGNSGQEQNALNLSGKLIRDILAGLEKQENGISNDLTRVRDLVAQVSRYGSINERIETINSSFQAVRVNILIQCSAMHIDEAIFRDVTSDIEELSRTLRQVAQLIQEELFRASYNLTFLEKKISLNQQKAGRLTGNAKTVVQRASNDIGQLLRVTEKMIIEASERSTRMNQLIDEIVVNMQFHDSLSQRADHILHSFEDIRAMCRPENISPSPEQLGASHLILDLQHRQLNDIIENINEVHNQASESFSAIMKEIEGVTAIFQNQEFLGRGQNNQLGKLTNSLLNALTDLGKQLTLCRAMTDEIETTARSTKNVSGNLVSLVEEVREMHDQIRIQSVNTIIMATNLNENGRSIRVLAKEISALSERTGELLGEVDDLRKIVNQKVNSLCPDSKEDDAGEPVTHEATIQTIKASYSELERQMAAIPPRVNAATGRIITILSGLRFMMQLRQQLQDVAHRIETARETASPWEGMASAAGEEISQLINRYTMQQERTVHAMEQDKLKAPLQLEEDIFF